VTHALGSPTRPLSADQVRAKFHSLWSGYDGDAVFGQLSMLDTLDDVGPLVERVSAVIVGP
jgi:hypothetical protein